MNKIKEIIKEDKWLILATVLVLILRFTNTLSINIVSGQSMMPNYHNFEFTVGSCIGDIQRGDVVVARPYEQNGDKRRVIKRVVGLPGETVEFKFGTLYINGEIYDEFYLDNDYIQNSRTQNWTIVLKDGEYLILGDNRDNSHDGRYYGAVTEDQIIQKIYLHHLNPAFWFVG